MIKIDNKKEKIKFILIIVVIFGVAIYYFICYRKNDEEISYTNILVNENFEENVVDKEEIKSTIKVYVTGEVNNPGVIELNTGARIEDAINLSGGITQFANLKKVNLAYVLEDGQKLYIPNVNDKEIDYISNDNGEGVIESEEKANSKVNINTNNINELMELPGVGEALAQRIINYRNENGKFKNIEDLKNVSGIGEKKFENLKEFIVVK